MSDSSSQFGSRPRGVADRLSGFGEERPLGPAERLRLAMRERGYASIAEFGRAVGINDNRIHQQIKRNSLSKKDAPRYAEFLKVNLAWLLEGRGLMDATGADPALAGAAEGPDAEAERAAFAVLATLEAYKPLTPDQRFEAIKILTPVVGEIFARSRRDRRS